MVREILQITYLGHGSGQLRYNLFEDGRPMVTGSMTFSEMAKMMDGVLRTGEPVRMTLKEETLRRMDYGRR